MSDVDLRQLVDQFRSDLPQEKRCATCRHAIPVLGPIRSYEAGCMLLDLRLVADLLNAARQYTRVMEQHRAAEQRIAALEAERALVRDALLAKLRTVRAGPNDIGGQAFDNGVAIAAHAVADYFERARSQERGEG